jgi:hypothetical protein
VGLDWIGYAYDTLHHFTFVSSFRVDICVLHGLLWSLGFLLLGQILASIRSSSNLAFPSLVIKLLYSLSLHLESQYSKTVGLGI